MKLLEYIGKLQKLTRLLKMERTGGVVNIANYMGTHRNTVYNYMLELRAMGAEIEYDKNRNTYYFKKPFDIEFTIRN